MLRCAWCMAGVNLFTFASSLLRQLMWLLQSSPGSPKSLGGQQAHHESNPLPRKVNLNLILNHWRFDVFCGFIQLRQTLAISPLNFLQMRKLWPEGEGCLRWSSKLISRGGKYRVIRQPGADSSGEIRWHFQAQFFFLF